MGHFCFVLFSVGLSCAALTAAAQELPPKGAVGEVLRLAAADSASDGPEYVLYCGRGQAELRVEARRDLPMTTQLVFTKLADAERRRAVHLTAQRAALGIFRPTLVANFVSALLQGEPPLLLLPDGHSFLPGPTEADLRATVLNSLDACGWRLVNGRVLPQTLEEGLPPMADGKAYGEPLGAAGLLVVEEVSWVELRAAKGERNFQQLLHPGDHLFLSTEPGQVLMLGNLPAAHLFIQGRQVDLPREQKGLLRAVLLDAFLDTVQADATQQACVELGRVAHAPTDPDGPAGHRSFERPVYLAGQKFCQVVLSQH